MSVKFHPQTPELVLVLGLFFLSNILTFGYAFWLVSALVLLAAIVWVLLTGVAVWILTRQGALPDLGLALRQNWLIVPFLIFAGLSVFWSVRPEISLYRWLTLLCTVLAGAYIGRRFNVRQIIRLASVFGVYVLFLGSLLVVLFPEIGVMNYHVIQGAWKGLYWHKNHMGLLAAFFNTLFLLELLLSLRAGGKAVVLWGLLYLFSIGFVYQTDSVAAYLTTAALHGLMLLALLLLRYRKKIRQVHYLGFAVLAAASSIFLFANLDRFLGFFNRNSTLTGRVPLWTYLFEEYIRQRPALGYGFNAFWYVPAHQEATQHAAGYPDTIIIADNGFLDILVNTGLLGLSSFLVLYALVWWRSLRLAWRMEHIEDFFPALLMAYTLLANISWSLLFENEGFFLLLMMAVLFATTRARTPVFGRTITP